MKKWALFAVLGLFSLGLSASELTGMWKHDDQPVWVEISFDGDMATGTVLRNDNKPDAVGATFLKEVKSEEGEQGPWAGQVYAAALNEFKDAKITLPETDAMKITVKVGFISRSVSWTRVAEVPEAVPAS
jgi:uncharacterized protein (DUF2147 family)